MNRRRFVALIASATPAGAALAMPTPTPATESRTRACRYLVGRQSKDGAWRSKVYGAFQTGEALTPIVTRALWGRDRPATDAAIEWLLKNHEQAVGVFPVHNASWMLELAAMDERLQPLGEGLEKHLRKLQLGSGLGWKKGEASFGGWSYVGVAPQFREGIELAPMQESNLSPTVFAVNGLRRAGVKTDDPVLAEAADFIRSCQNFSEEGGKNEYDDGGFFQMRTDRWRNKAGVAGTEESGRERFRSYYSATADGLRGLLMCGVPESDPRVLAAMAWLRANPALDDVPHLMCYAAWARSRAIALIGERPVDRRPPEVSPRPVQRLVPRELELTSGSTPGVPLLQNRDGSYLNPSGEMRENDPLVATSLLVMAEQSHISGMK